MNKFQKIFSMTGLVLGLMLVMTSCTKVNINEFGGDDDEKTLNYFELLQGGTAVHDTADTSFCFSVNYPVSVQFSLEDVQTLGSAQELDEAVQIWILANPNPISFPDFVYPLSVNSLNSGQIQVETSIQMSELLNACYGGGDCDDDDCDDDDD